MNILNISQTQANEKFHKACESQNLYEAIYWLTSEEISRTADISYSAFYDLRNLAHKGHYDYLYKLVSNPDIAGLIDWSKAGTGVLAGIIQEQNIQALRQFGSLINIPLYSKEDNFCFLTSCLNAARYGKPEKTRDFFDYFIDTAQPICLEAVVSAFAHICSYPNPDALSYFRQTPQFCELLVNAPDDIKSALLRTACKTGHADAIDFLLNTLNANLHDKQAFKEVMKSENGEAIYTVLLYVKTKEAESFPLYEDMIEKSGREGPKKVLQHINLTDKLPQKAQTARARHKI